MPPMTLIAFIDGAKLRKKMKNEKSFEVNSEKFIYSAYD
jgi:hypothetical protein